MMRCFVALGIDDAIRVRIEAAVARLRSAIEKSAADGERGGISWTRPHGWHVTLKFLGEVAEERIAAIGAALSNAVASFGRFELALSGVHGFPAGRTPHAVVVGIRDAGRCAELAERVDVALAGLDFPREERAHVAHLTLARVRNRAAARNVRSAVEARGGEAFGTLCIERVGLYESLLGPQGSRYREVMSFALASST
jgi:2'-5' RNA ligase